jgi:hypothetical protein
MRLWWLSFKGGTAAIWRAETLVHARLLAAADKVARACLFDAGFQVDPEFEQIHATSPRRSKGSGTGRDVPRVGTVCGEDAPGTQVGLHTTARNERRGNTGPELPFW